MKIFVRNNDVNKALRILKKKLIDEGDAKKLRAKDYFVSKSEQNRLDEKAGRKRWLKKRNKIEQKLVKTEQNLLNKNRRNKKTDQRQNKVA